jgi:aryl-alcohol dehydrogenase-like predicted oxidoreductase
MANLGPDSSIPRRTFLQAGAVAATAVTALSSHSVEAQDAAAPDAAKPILPKRVLGKTGAEVTLLNMGTWRAPGALDRLLRQAFREGVRTFDTAKSYGSEPAFKRWFADQPDLRKQIFLVTKDIPRASTSELLKQVDQRLEALGTDYIDLLFIHALGDHNIEMEMKWPESQEFKETIEALKKTKKVKFVGFSSHHARRAEILQAAARGGFVDAIMLQYTPWLPKDDALNLAIDACHAKGIGLISMKQIAGHVVDDVEKRAPVLKERGLNKYQGLLQAIWTDERIACSCVSLRNTDHVRENAEAARKYEPLSHVQLMELRDACLADGPTLCADCDGRCSKAAGTKARLGDLTRYLTYHEHHGYRGDARAYYAELNEEEKDWKDADLTAAREACPSGLDFASLLPKVDRLLG